MSDPLRLEKALKYKQYKEGIGKTITRAFPVFFLTHACCRQLIREGSLVFPEG